MVKFKSQSVYASASRLLKTRLKHLNILSRFRSDIICIIIYTTLFCTHLLFCSLYNHFTWHSTALTLAYLQHSFSALFYFPNFWSIHHCRSYSLLLFYNNIILAWSRSIYHIKYLMLHPYTLISVHHIISKPQLFCITEYLSCIMYVTFCCFLNSGYISYPFICSSIISIFNELEGVFHFVNRLH